MSQPARPLQPNEREPYDKSDDNTITIYVRPDAFRLFVVWLYHGPDSLLPGLAYTSDPRRWTANLIDLWTFAEDFKVESLKNGIVDTVQHLPLDDDFFVRLIDFDEWACEMSPALGYTSVVPKYVICGLIVEYMYDKLAYEITNKGWGHFMSVAGTAWAEMMHNPNACRWRDTPSRVRERLVGQLSLAHELKIKGDPADPADRMDCRWHQHKTLESFRLCPRYNEEDEAAGWTRLSQNGNRAQRQRQMELEQMIEAEEPLGGPHQLYLEEQLDKAHRAMLEQLVLQTEGEQTQLELWKSFVRSA